MVLSTDLLLCLTTPVRHFRNFTMNITAYIETPRVAHILTEFGKLRIDWSIQRSPERPTQYNLVRCSYVEINIGILIRLNIIYFIQYIVQKQLIYTMSFQNKIK